MCCVTRARTGTLCTSESGFSWISCILDPGFLCIVPIHCSVSLGAAGSWERQIWMHSVPFFRRGVCAQNLGFFRGRPSLSSPTCPLALFYQHIRLITTVDTMTEEKRCDWCYTSAESNRAETMEWRGVKRTKRGHGQGAQYLTNTFLLRKFDQHRDRECQSPLRMRSSKSSGDRTKTGIETPHWQLRVCQRVEACLSKPFLMIEWWTLEGAHLLLAQMTIFGHRRAAAYCDFTIITPRLEWIAWGCWDDKELVQG